MNEISNIIVGAFILIGAFLSLVTAFGLLRLPDVYTRNHASSKSATLGVLLVLVGAFFHFYFVKGEADSRLILSIMFIFLTSPIAGHLITRAAYNTGVQMRGEHVQDDLKKARADGSSQGKTP